MYLWRILDATATWEHIKSKWWQFNIKIAQSKSTLLKRLLPSHPRGFILEGFLAAGCKYWKVSHCWWLALFEHWSLEECPGPGPLSSRPPCYLPPPPPPHSWPQYQCNTSLEVNMRLADVFGTSLSSLLSPLRSLALGLEESKDSSQFSSGESDWAMSVANQLYSW